MATLDTVKEVLESNLDIDPENVTEDATFEDLGIDSLDMVELVCDIEEKLDIEFGEPECIDTIGKMDEYIQAAEELSSQALES